MWKQLNKIVGKLSYGTKNNNRSEGHAAGVELAVRPTVVRGTELQSISARANGHSSDGNVGASHTYVSDGYVGHPLEAAIGPLPAQSACPAVTAAEQDSLHAHSVTAQLSDQERSDAESSIILAIDQLLQQLLSQDWVSQCPSGARLVLSLCYELAAVSSPQQQHDSGILQLLATSSSWQAACAHCQDTFLLRALVSHYLPDADIPAASDSWQEQLREQYSMQDASAALSPAQFASAVVAAAQECDRSSSGPDCVQSLEPCIVLGEAAQFQQQQQQESWQCMQHLAAAQLPSATARPHVQLDTAGVWWHLQAWGTAVVQAAESPQGQQQNKQQQLVDASTQQPSAQWDALLAVLAGLQQQVQEALPVTQQPEQQGRSGAAQAEFLAGRAGVGSGVATVKNATVLQQRHGLLHKLCGTLPVLLQPADLASPLQAHEAAGVPSSMELVVLLRLAAATSTLWLPLLAACHDMNKGEAATASAAAGVCVSVGDGEGSNSSTPTAQSKLQAPPALVSKDDLAVAALWQGAAAGQAPAELTAGPGVALAAAGGKTIAPSLRSPRSSWPDELLSTAQLWPGDVESEDDAEAISREERTLRSWINSVLHQGSNAHSPGADAHPALSHSYSVDSSLQTGRAQGQASGAVAHDPLRAQSMGGGDAAAAHRPIPLQVAVASGGSGGVFRSSSAGAAAVATHLDGEGASSGATHSRSISAEAFGNGAEVSLDGWAGEPAAPSTPTAAAAAAASAGSGPHFGAAGASSAARVAAGVPSISSVSSLFGAELRSGVLLLEILELLQPGCIDWRLANRPPFVSRTAQLKALENCQLALKVAQEELGLPLVSMSPRDIVVGRRKIILSLVYQLMRFNTMQLLESISAVHSEQHAGSHSRRSSATGGSEPSTPTAAAAADADKLGRSSQQQLPPSGLQFARQSGGRVNIRSSSKKQRRQVAITEQDILDWANSKLQQVKPLESSDAASSQAPVIRSFRDSLLSTGVILLQLLHVLAPDLFDLSFVTPGLTAEQRQSNARYALSLADKMGCSLFLVWEDLVDPPQPRMVLVLLASLMYQDLKRQQQQQQAPRPTV